MIEMAEQKPPYFDESPIRAMFKIVNELPPKFKNPKDHSPECNDFVSRCLVKDPWLRGKAADLIKVAVIFNDISVIISIHLLLNMLLLHRLYLNGLLRSMRRYGDDDGDGHDDFDV